eukprot:13946944-Alexandrium_andersonii.AAC.1
MCIRDSSCSALVRLSCGPSEATPSPTCIYRPGTLQRPVHSSITDVPHGAHPLHHLADDLGAERLAPHGLAHLVHQA